MGGGRRLGLLKMWSSVREDILFPPCSSRIPKCVRCLSTSPSPCSVGVHPLHLGWLSAALSRSFPWQTLLVSLPCGCSASHLLVYLLCSIQGGGWYDRQCINASVEWGLGVLLTSLGLLLAHSGDATRAGTMLTWPARYWGKGPDEQHRRKWKG